MVKIAFHTPVDNRRPNGKILITDEVSIFILTTNKMPSSGTNIDGDIRSHPGFQLCNLRRTPAPQSAVFIL